MKVKEWSTKTGTCFNFEPEGEEEARVIMELRRLIKLDLVKVSRKSFYCDDNGVTLELDRK